MQKLILKVALIAFPFFLWTAVELCVLPRGYFNFRAWEVLTASALSGWLPSELYPNQKLEMTVVGSSAYRTRFAVPKRVRWEIDRFGYRKRDSDQRKYPLVIVGDSTVAGASLSQDDILSEQLEESIGISVYPYGTASPSKFYNDNRFKQNSPEILIFCYAELRLMRPGLFRIYQGPDYALSYDSALLPAAVFVDRLLKQSMLRTFWAVLRDGSRIAAVQGRQSILDPRRVFYDGSNALKAISVEVHNDIVDSVVTAIDLYEQRIPTVIFMPVPSAENIFHDHIEGGVQPENLTRLLVDIAARGKRVIDLQPAFRAAQERGELLFHRDDPHWDPGGVAVAVAVTTAYLKEHKLIE